MPRRYALVLSPQAGMVYNLLKIVGRSAFLRTPTAGGRSAEMPPEEATMFEHVQPIVGSYEVRPAACVEYNPRAADVARSVATTLREHLPSARAEHVGSTSVPGCAGKGIVDLMIAVADDQMPAVNELLDRLGFQPQPGDDPHPETRPMRVGAFVHGGETFLLHIHVIPASSPEVDEMRFFRACLRADEELLHAYVARKREIVASGVADSQEYCRLKAEFIKQVLG
jgi:GrpB-like predicted nucleotidyltransferase (UPF0157 family)